MSSVLSREICIPKFDRKISRLTCHARHVNSCYLKLHSFLETLLQFTLATNRTIHTFQEGYSSMQDPPPPSTSISWFTCLHLPTCLLPSINIPTFSHRFQSRTVLKFEVPQLTSKALLEFWHTLRKEPKDSLLFWDNHINAPPGKFLRLCFTQAEIRAHAQMNIV